MANALPRVHFPAFGVSVSFKTRSWSVARMGRMKLESGYRRRVAPLFGLALLQGGAKAVERARSEAGRPGRPRIVTGRYFSLGPGADETANQYIHHYYRAEFFERHAFSDPSPSTERTNA
jgi:hypothetical protein